MFCKGYSLFTVTSVLQDLEVQMLLMFIRLYLLQNEVHVILNRKTESSSLYHLKWTNENLLFNELLIS